MYWLVSSIFEQTKGDAMEERKKLVVLLPSYKHVPTLGMLTLVSWAFQAPRHYDIELSVVSNLYIEDARYTLARTAVSAHHREKVDAFVWLDDDQVWRYEDFHNHVETFFKSKYDALSAMYYSRSRPDKVVAQMADDEQNIRMSENTGIQDCEAVGFGMLCMKPSMLAKMLGRYSTELFRTEFEPNKEKDGGFIHYTEDKMFFKRAKKYNEGTKSKWKIGVNTDVPIGHCGVVR